MPTVWWSTPPFNGPPSLGVQFAPSSSVNAERLVVPESCDVNHRPVRWSITPIGSGRGKDGAAATVYVPDAGLVSVTISIWFGPLPEVPASEPSGAHTLRSQSPNGCSLIVTVKGEDGALTVSRKLSHVGSFAPAQPPAVGG